MASGDPPIIGNPADPTGTITIIAMPASDNDHMLRVKLKKNRLLKITIDKGGGDLAEPVVARAADWRMIIEEIS